MYTVKYSDETQNRERSVLFQIESKGKAREARLGQCIKATGGGQWAGNKASQQWMVMA